MLKASALLKQASAYSQTFSQRVEVLRAGTVIMSSIPVVSGRIFANRTSSPRMTCELILGVEPWEPLPFNNRTCQIRIWRGVESLGQKEALQQGTFRIDDWSRTPEGLVSLQGSGLEAYQIDGRLLVPRTPPFRASTVHTIIDLIREIRPRATVRIETTRNLPITQTTPWERDRWDAIDDLAASIECDVFADARGDYVIRDIPRVSGTPVLWVKQGAGGLMVDQKQSETRDQVYNGAVAMNQTTVPGSRPVWGKAIVQDPDDDLYFYGEYGQVPIFHLSQWYTQSWQCERYARKLLVDAMALNSSMTFSTPPTVWWLEVGDLVGVDMLDGSQQVHLLQSMDANLGPEGMINFGTVSTKRAARMEDFPEGTIE